MNEFVYVGVVYSVTRCVLLSSVATITLCGQYHFSPVASRGQGVKLRNSLADDKHPSQWLLPQPAPIKKPHQIIRADSAC